MSQLSLSSPSFKIRKLNEKKEIFPKVYSIEEKIVSSLTISFCSHNVKNYENIYDDNPCVHKLIPDHKGNENDYTLTDDETLVPPYNNETLTISESQDTTAFDDNEEVIQYDAIEVILNHYQDVTTVVNNESFNYNSSHDDDDDDDNDINDIAGNQLSFSSIDSSSSFPSIDSSSSFSSIDSSSSSSSIDSSSSFFETSDNLSTILSCAEILSIETSQDNTGIDEEEDIHHNAIETFLLQYPYENTINKNVSFKNNGINYDYDVTNGDLFSFSSNASLLSLFDDSDIDSSTTLSCADYDYQDNMHEGDDVIVTNNANSFTKNTNDEKKNSFLLDSDDVKEIGMLLRSCLIQEISNAFHATFGSCLMLLHPKNNNSPIKKDGGIHMELVSDIEEYYDDTIPIGSSIKEIEDLNAGIILCDEILRYSQKIKKKLF